MRKILTPTGILLLLCLGTLILVHPKTWGQPSPKSEELETPPDETVEFNESEEKQLSTDADTTKAVQQEIEKTNTFWTAPDFSHQSGALGWTPETFQIPPGFLKRFNFWIDIYTKYNTNQVLLHDAHHLDIVYEVIDLGDIDSNASLDPHEKEVARRKRVKDEKKKIRDELLHIQQVEESPSKMSPEELALFHKFRFVLEKNKFREASGRHRLRMQLGQKDRFVQGLYFSGRYIREMERIFKEEGVPIELTRLPFVESSFNLYAYSKVGASGIWQFMRSTGKLFLHIDSVVDQRNDPLAATRAAARLLRYNYNLLKSWPLALTAYNHGPQGVSAIVKKMKTDDINEIVWNTTRRRFGFASENFYAEFLAALWVESHADQYFGKVEVSPPLIYENVDLPRDMTFGEVAMSLKTDKDDGLDRARLYNPYFTRLVLAGHRKINEGFSVRVPKGFHDLFLAQEKTIDPTKVQVLFKSGLYKIMPGDTLSSISHDFGISIKALLEANNFSAKHILRPGQRLIVPTMENH